MSFINSTFLLSLQIPCKLCQTPLCTACCWLPAAPCGNFSAQTIRGLLPICTNPQRPSVQDSTLCNNEHGAYCNPVDYREEEGAAASVRQLLSSCSHWELGCTYNNILAIYYWLIIVGVNWQRESRAGDGKGNRPMGEISAFFFCEESVVETCARKGCSYPIAQKQQQDDGALQREMARDPMLQGRADADNTGWSYQSG